MKILRYILSAGVLMSVLCVVLVACNEPEGPELQGEDVPFTVYSPQEGSSGEELSVRWMNLDHGSGTDGIIIIINSDENLQNYVEGDYPPIDFSKKTLLLAAGHTSTAVNKVMIKSVNKLSVQEYRLTVEILVKDTTIPGYWQVAILTDKLDEGSEVELNTVINNNY